eukprot:m.338250 g.338250  ORF g.338250 m.338250 type:complete len:1050 (+) comp18353_c0_seq1:343-3492(+)
MMNEQPEANDVPGVRDRRLSYIPVGDTGDIEDNVSDDDDDDVLEPNSNNHNVIQRNLTSQSGEARNFEGWLQKYAGRMKGFHKRWVSIAQNTLIHSKRAESTLKYEIDLYNASVAEENAKNLDHGFVVIAQSKKILLRAESRVLMEEWMSAIKKASATRRKSDLEKQLESKFTSAHSWYLKHQHSKICNVCQQPLPSQKKSLACEVCQYRCHKKCAINAECDCKWTAMPTIPKDCIEPTGEIRHQWVLGNLPSNAKCVVCKKSCGSSRQLQDYRCLWCHSVCHAACRLMFSPTCSYGRHRISTLWPTGVHPPELGNNNPLKWKVSVPAGTSPLIVFINPKSGGNDGVRIMRMLKGLLNPLQVFDLSRGGPKAGLELIKSDEDMQFRALGCGGDGTIGWILQEADKMNIKNMRLAVLPIGTGNDLARVLGWSSAFNGFDIQSLSDTIDAVEKSKSKLFDRWGIAMSNETPLRTQDLTTVDTTHRFHPVSPLHANSELELEANMSESSLASGEDIKEFQRKFALLKRMGRLLDLFLHSIDKMFSGQEESGMEDLSIDDLSGMIEDFVEACHELFRCFLRHQQQGHSEFLELCDKLEMEATGFIALLFEEESSDLDASHAMNSLKLALIDVMENANEFAKTLDIDMKDEMKKSVVLKAHQTVKPPKISVPETKRKSSTGSTSSAGKTKSNSVSKRLTSKSRRIKKPIAPMPSITEGEFGSDISVMNNYCGIGLDAKVAMDFGVFRQNHPEKCRGRMKNQMWYTVMSTREMMNQTCKNLQSRLVLECDGEIVQLPKLQGIIFLNIGSYAAGGNFWGSKVQKKFRPPSFDDGIIEVMALRGLSQMAAVKSLPGIAATRLAQARQVRITMLPGDDIPIQVDGEAWMQRPCTLTVYHKGRVQMLCRDRALQQLLATWGPEISEKPHFMLSQLEEAKNKLVESTQEALKEVVGLETHLKVFAATATEASNLLKTSGKRIHQSNVFRYLSAVSPFPEALRSFIDFSDEVTVTAEETEAQEAPKWDIQSFVKSGPKLKEDLLACESALQKAYETCDVPN